MHVTKRHIKRPIVKHIFKDARIPVMPVIEINESVEESIDMAEETPIVKEIILEDVIEDVNEENFSGGKEEVIEGEKPKKKRTKKLKNVEENNIVE